MQIEPAATKFDEYKSAITAVTSDYDPHKAGYTASSFAVAFNLTRSILCTLVMLSLWIAQASAQSAVMIGLQFNDRGDGNGEQMPSYRTFLITFRDGGAQLAADIPDLIVPRKDGFWRVGVLHKGSAGKYGAQDFVYAVPARSVPHASESIIPIILSGIARRPTKPQLSL